MIDLLFKPTPRVVKLIAKIERFCGNWDYLSKNQTLCSSERQSQALIEGIEAVLELDVTAPPLSNMQSHSESLTSQLEISTSAEQTTFLSPTLADSSEANRDFDSAQHERPVSQINAFCVAHTLPASFSADGIQFLFDFITLNQTPRDLGTLLPRENNFRTVNIGFIAPNQAQTSSEIIFSTVPVFLIETRLKELIAWTQRQLELGNLHPLVVIGAFHLLFLQIHPYATANHRISFLLAWRLMREYGFSFVQFSHFAPFLSANSEWYFRSLRQAEKTTGSDWSTLNSWLELFLQSVAEAADLLESQTSQQINRFVPTTVQKRIIDTVRRHGAATRETIASATGIAVSTVKYNLSVLAEKGQLKREGGGRSTSYRAV